MKPKKRSHKLFDRIGDGFSYVPANTEGWGCLAAFAVLVLTLVGAGKLASDWLGSVVPYVIGWFLAAVALIAFMRFARRHS